jgi:RNA polymerase sigma-70 factor, ECF subfamily
MPLRVVNAHATTEEIELVASIRGGDDRAFTTVVERHHAAMLAVAKAYVLAPAMAERIAHDAWMAALAASDAFDGSISLRRWLLRFVVHAAAPLAARPDGTAPDATGPAVEAERFRGSGDGFPGHWRAYPRDWRALPNDILHGEEARRAVAAAVEGLPIDERTVITLRDIVGCPTREVCEILELPEAAARQRLHRARSRVRAALERHIDDRIA